MAGCPNYTTGINRRSAEGLICCGGFTQWRDLDTKIIGWSWVWICPTCGGWLRRDPWTPPADLPDLSSEALESSHRYPEALEDSERGIGPVATELAAF